MTSRRYQQKKAEQLADAERALAARREAAREASDVFEAVSSAYDRGQGSVDDYWDAHDHREATAQDMRVAEAWALRCQVMVDELMDAVR